MKNIAPLQSSGVVLWCARLGMEPRAPLVCSSSFKCFRQSWCHRHHIPWSARCTWFFYPGKLNGSKINKDRERATAVSKISWLWSTLIPASWHGHFREGHRRRGQLLRSAFPSRNLTQIATSSTAMLEYMAQVTRFNSGESCNGDSITRQEISSSSQTLQ